VVFDIFLQLIAETMASAKEAISSKQRDHNLRVLDKGKLRRRKLPLVQWFALSNISHGGIVAGEGFRTYSFLRGKPCCIWMGAEVRDEVGYFNLFLSLISHKPFHLPVQLISSGALAQIHS
jgi:hypothetical protein